MGRLDLPDVWRDEDDLPGRDDRTVDWWRVQYEHGRSDAAADRVLAESGIRLPAGVRPVNATARPSTRTRGLRDLTAREVEVTRLVAEGYTDAEIGAALAISPETVKSHLKHIIAALQARNRTHVATLALRQGVIS